MPLHYRWACAPFYEPWRACQHREDPCRPALRRAGRAGQQRRAIFQDLRENQEARANFPGPPAAALRLQGKERCLAREEQRALLEQPSFVWPREPPWAPYAYQMQ